MNADLLQCRLTRQVVSLLIATFVIVALSSCGKDDDYGRSEYIKCYQASDPSKSDLSQLDLSIRGGEMTINVSSNVDFTYKFETDDDVQDWLKVSGADQLSTSNATELKLQFDEHPSPYIRRRGCLWLNTDAAYLNKFIEIEQGFAARVEGGFDWLKYGTTDPYSTANEKEISDWTKEQRDYGWSSEGECYGKSGYIRLGNDHGDRGDITTPYASGITTDTLALFCFKAVAYDDGVVTDCDNVTVEVIGGGEFLDGSTEMVVEGVGHLDAASVDVATEMWSAKPQEVYVVSSPDNKFTSNTRLKITSGDGVDPAVNSRLFVDDIYVFALRSHDYHLIGGKLPWEK